MFVRFFLLIVAFLSLPNAAFAQTPHIRASLEAETLKPAYGQDVTIAIRMTPEAGWHGYWQNPGDAGAAPIFEWSLPKGATISAPSYPVPEKLLVADLMNHVFNGEHALLYKLRLPQLPAGTPIVLKAKGQWLACTDEICVPEGGDVAINLTVGDGQIDAALRTRFDGWRAKLPRPLGSAAAFAVDGKTLRIAVPYPEAAAVKAPWFYAATENAVAYSAPQTVRRNGDLLIVETQVGDAAPKSLDGVLAIGGGQGLMLTAEPGAVPTGGSVIGEAASTVDWQLILLSIAGAILGGLILNIMPCVFPIVSLKALSLARAGGNEADAKADALSYSAGVIVTCLALGGALLAIRAGGAQVGWAFQLQDPRVIFALLLLTAAITLNLLGLFHLRGFGGGEGLAGQGGKAGAFWTGALAAFVATPCTGPFMAAALGAALVLPVPAALGIFAGLGLGMALPFLALGFVPALRSRMPKPGAWMVTFQRWMAVPMALTVAALLWLLWRQTGQIGLIIGIVAVAAVSVVAWFSGRKSGGSALMPVFASVAVALAIGAYALPSPTPRDAAMIAGAAPFSESQLANLRKANRPVFLYFTADWCLTCKVNEKAAIDRAEVRDAFDAANVAVMAGDWTNGDPAITRFLEAQGRSGVPLYLYYPKGATTPQILPQVLTPGLLTALVSS